MLLDKPVRELLAAFSSPDPTPGGGSASGVSSAIGASLLMMVAALPKTRSGADDEKAALALAARALTAVRQQLAEAIDADATAYEQVVAAYKLPKAPPEEQPARKAAIQRALKAATDVPLGVMRLSVAALDEAETVAANGHKGAASDVGVAVALLRAGLYGAGLNVDINLGRIQDEEYAGAVRAEVERYTRQAAAAAAAAEAFLEPLANR
jgi:formiminotetrahydrofolate cyclodeaminase